MAEQLRLFDSNLQSDLETAVAKLYTYGRARDRAVDREVRTFTLTDDEALALLAALRKEVES